MLARLNKQKLQALVLARPLLRPCSKLHTSSVSLEAKNFGGLWKDKVNNQRGNFKDGDWICSKCRSHNFRSREHCFGCGNDKSLNNTVISNPASLAYKRGDWVCLSCQYHNYAYRTTCLQCDTQITEESKAKVQTALENQGDWTCKSCDGWNFSWRQECFKCKTVKP